MLNSLKTHINQALPLEKSYHLFAFLMQSPKISVKLPLLSAAGVSSPHRYLLISSDLHEYQSVRRFRKISSYLCTQTLEITFNNTKYYQTSQKSWELTNLSQLSMGYDSNNISILNGRQTVGNNQNCAALNAGFQGFLNHCL